MYWRCKDKIDVSHFGDLKEIIIYYANPTISYKRTTKGNVISMLTIALVFDFISF